MKRQFITSLLLLSAINICLSKTIYFNQFNKFQSIALEKVVEGTIVDENNTSMPIFRPYMINLVNNNCRFEIRFANYHNQENRKYYVTDTTTGAKTSIINTTHGVIWNYIDNNNYYRIQLQCHNSNRHDILDRRYMNIQVARVSNGIVSVIKECNIDDNIDLFGNYNVLSLSNDAHLINIKIGNNELRSVCLFNDSISGFNNIGYFVGAGAKVVVQRAALSYNPQMEKVLSTDWNIENLNRHFAKSNDIYEGYWEYLDRDIDQTKLRLGGRYKIAIVKSNNGYDVLYIDGGKVNSQNWKCGMIKGRLINTSFIDSYKLNWYDAMMEIFSVDVSAVFINNSILEIQFPIHNSKVRFIKSVL